MVNIAYLIIDTSGSMPALSHYLKKFIYLSKCLSFIGIRIICCDTKVTYNHLFHIDEVPESFPRLIPCVGGSDLNPAFRLISRKYPRSAGAIFVLTDGYVRIPKRPPNKPVIWVSTSAIDGLDIMPYGHILTLYNLRRSGEKT